MIRFFAGHPTAANILMAAIVLVGLAVLPTLNRETFPEIQAREVMVTVPYPGASPLEVEDAICNPLEDATDGIPFLIERRCHARDDVGSLTLEMAEGASMSRFLDDIRAAVDGITEFPDDAEEPIIEELGRTDQVVSVAVTAELPRRELRQLTEYYRKQLLALPEVPIVTVQGFSEQELSVLVRPEILGEYQISLDELAALIRNQALDLPAGVLESEDQEYQIRYQNVRRSVAELEDLVIFQSEQGGRILLGDIAEVRDTFLQPDEYTEINGLPAGLLEITKNKTDDTLTIYHAVLEFVESENARLPEGTRLVVTQAMAPIVEDRLGLLLKNGWQGLLLASVVLLLFFHWRYTFWIVVGLPISFIGGLVVMKVLGVSINMISMVGLLMAIGILMDDAIVVAESVAAEYGRGKSPLDAAVDGIRRVGRGVIAAFATSALLFGGLLFLQGDVGQIMAVFPVVMLSVLTLSLVEAFLILPNHLSHSLSKVEGAARPAWRERFEAGFEQLRERVGRAADWSIRFRYAVVGVTLGLFVLSVGMLPAGVLKFKFFPDLEGDNLEARILMPQGTPFSHTEAVVNQLLGSLQATLAELPDELEGELVENIRITFGQNPDAGETGPHLAVIALDLLGAEQRVTSLNELRRRWMAASPAVPGAISLQFTEPTIGPAGRAIEIRLSGDDLEALSAASWQLQGWLKGYHGVSNVMDDLRPGKPQFSVTLLPGALSSGVDGRIIATQLRAAYQGIKVDDIYQRRAAYEINVKLAQERATSLAELPELNVITSGGEQIPVAAVATLDEQREFAGVMRIDYERTVTITGDIDNDLANTEEVIGDTRARFLPELQRQYPGLRFALEGEVKNSAETIASVRVAFGLGIIGVFLLLSFQFRNYREPIVVLINIPLAMIGVIWGHIAMGLDLTQPSMVGFVSLAGVVVNDSILLVEFVKQRNREGMTLHDAAGQAVRDRFRAIFLTSITTVAGMLPLLSETSMQAQFLVPMVASIAFGMLSSTLLLLLVLPAAYSILEDFGFTEVSDRAPVPEATPSA